MSNLLVSYASSEGQTARIASRISEQAKELGYDVDLQLTNDIDDESSLQKYDAIIIGAPVYRVKFPRCTSKFIRSHINELKKIKCAFFSVSLTAISKKQEDIEAISQLTNEFPMNLDWKPDRVESFAGALAYTKYNIFLRFIIKMMVKSHDGDTDTTRDYEYTNWNDVQKFSHEFLSLN